MLGPLTERSTTRVLTIGALLLVALFLVFGTYMGGRVRQEFYLEKVRAAETIAIALTDSAKIPLLGDDTLTLHGLLEGAANARGLVYAVILDAGRRVKANTNPAHHAGIFKELPGGLKSIAGEDGSRSGTRVLPSGARILQLSRPVTFKDKTIGYVILGFSREAIDADVWAVGRFLWGGFGILGLCTLAVLVGGWVLFSSRTSSEATRAADAAVLRGALEALPESALDRNQVTVLFAGVKGFRNYADTREPGEVMRDMNGYLAVATATIARFGGEVDKFIGDAVVGVFRSTVLSPDHVERAVRSAAALQESLRQAGGDGNPLYSLIGIGISSGVALAGHLAAGEFRDSLYIGESFKLAYLLHVMADPGEIVIGREVYQAMESSLSVEPLPPREMMERTESWQNFRLLRVLDERKIGV